MYSKYSTDRDKRFSIRTDKLIDDNDNVLIKKYALFEEGMPHLKNMAYMYEKLKNRYDSKIFISKSYMDGETLNNKYVSGLSYHKYIVGLIDKKDVEILKAELNHYRDTIYYDSNPLKDFEITPGFIEVFGDVDELKNERLLSSNVTDIDMIFDNIIVSESGKWNLIDYEWSFEFPIPNKFVLFRTLWYLYDSTRMEDVISWEDILKWADISSAVAECFLRMEIRFQEYIMGDTVSVEGQMLKRETSVKYFNQIIEKEQTFDESEDYKRKYYELIQEYEAAMEIKRYKRYEELLEEFEKLREIYIKKEETLYDVNQEICALRQELADVNLELHNIKESKWWKLRNMIKD